MFSLDGLSRIRKVKWQNLKPGSIIIGGVNINGSPLPEMSNFTVLSDPLIRDLLSRYHFLAGREVVIADVAPNFSPHELSRQIQKQNESIIMMNQFRQEFQSEKTKILKELGLDINLKIPIIGTDYVERDHLIKDTYNSFSYVYETMDGEGEIPSFFNNLSLSMSIGDLLTQKLNKKFNLPEDKEVMLHMVIDFSRSMDSGNKLNLILSAVNNIYRHIKGTLENTKIRLYAFSDSCRPTSYPVDDTEIARGDTSYSSFMKKVLHHKAPDIHNTLILFTDGLPTDRSEALKMSELIRKNKVDYTQIIFQIRDEQRHEVESENSSSSLAAVDNVVTEMKEGMLRVELSDLELDAKMKGIYEDFTEIAEICAGNQIILGINELIPLVSVECYDRYLGLLTLAERELPQEENSFQKWQFPRL